MKSLLIGLTLLWAIVLSSNSDGATCSPIQGTWRVYVMVGGQGQFSGPPAPPFIRRCKIVVGSAGKINSNSFCRPASEEVIPITGQLYRAAGGCGLTGWIEDQNVYTEQWRIIEAYTSLDGWTISGVGEQAWQGGVFTFQGVRRK